MNRLSRSGISALLFACLLATPALLHSQEKDEKGRRQRQEASWRPLLRRKSPQ